MKKYYIEYHVVGDELSSPVVSTFHHRNVASFIELFVKTGKRVVHLELIEPIRKVLYTKRP